VINGRTADRVEEAANELRGEYPEATITGVDADLSTASGADRIIDAVPKADILINNVGIFEVKDFADITDDDWMHFFETNVMSGVRLSRHYFPQMMAQDWGRIVFISSESGLHIPEEMIHYGMTKSAQLSVARGLAELTKGTNVTVNSVLPGPTWSEGVSTFVEEMADDQGISVEAIEEEFFSTARPTSLLQRFIEPAEVGDFVAFVSSPLSSATNGAALRADGGVVRAMA
jgi:NAD(P)-dependent dehydrogenase (short-subunit alcohol dehydrogenase family)